MIDLGTKSKILSLNGHRLARVDRSGPSVEVFRMHRFCLVLLTASIASLLMGERTGAASSWKPVTQEELKMAASASGDPDADAIILFREGELNDDATDGTSLKIYVRVKIFTDRGRKHAAVELPYRTELGKISDLQARTIRPDGTAIEVDQSDVFDKVLVKSNQGSWRAISFNMPAVEAGSIIEYRYRQTYPLGFRYFAFDLQSDLYIRKLRYSIRPRASSKRDVRWVCFNADNPGRFAPVWDGRYNIAVDGIPPFRREPHMQPEDTVKIWGWLYYADDIETNPEKYWRDYARRTFERDGYQTRPSGVVRKIASTITLADNTDDQKVSRIYNYVQSEIQNLGSGEPAQEPGRVIRRSSSPEQTLRRRYGTPVEINRLFVSMLRAVELDARVAQVTTRDESFFHRSFGDFLQFNNEVTALVLRDGSVRFFDPGTAFCPIGMMSWEKEAVTTLVYDKKGALFIETPITDAEKNSTTRTLNARVERDAGVLVTADWLFDGQSALRLRKELSVLNGDEQTRYAISQLRTVNPQIRIDDDSVQFENLKTSTEPLRKSFAFSIPQFAERTDKRLILRPGLLSNEPDSFLPSPVRSNNVYFEFPWSESERVILKVPDGYQLESLPEPVEADIGAARYFAGFKREGNGAVYERRLLVNAINFKVEQYATIKAFFDRVHQGDHLAISYREQ